MRSEKKLTYGMHLAMLWSSAELGAVYAGMSPARRQIERVCRQSVLANKAVVMKEEIVHFALSIYTACNEHIVGSTVNCYEEDAGVREAVLAGHGTNVQHTCIVENVTCPRCLDSNQYKGKVEEEYE